MSVSATTPKPVTLELMGGSRRRHRKERLVRVLFLAAAVLGLVISLAIVVALVGRAIQWLIDIDLGWLWTEGWFPRQDEFDVLTIFSGTVMIAVIAMFVATPLGLGAAAYLSEYASPRTRRTFKPILETLASIPSVVLGYFALQVINPELVQRIFASAAGATGGSLRTSNPLDRGQTMTGAISSLAIGSDQVRGSGRAFESLYFVGLMLFVITFLLNVVSERFVRRVRNRY